MLAFIGGVGVMELVVILVLLAVIASFVGAVILIVWLCTRKKQT